jgi:hypothetical protein
MTMTEDDPRHIRPRGPAPDRTPEVALEAAFAALRARPADPGEALVARVMADAAARTGAAGTAQAPRLPPVALRRAPGDSRRASGWRAARPWRGLAARAPMPAGLAAALMLGVWIGLAVPVPVPSTLPALEEALFGPLPLAGLVEPGELFAE